MINKKEEPNYSENFKRLAGLTKNTSSNKPNKDIILQETFKDGKTYAIVKEFQRFVIKESVNGQVDENSLSYIGGDSERGKYKYRYNTHLDAQKNFTLLAQSINESYIDERREGDLEGQEEQPAPAPGEGGGLDIDLNAPQGDNPAPQPDMGQAPAEPAPSPEAPANDVAPEGEPAMGGEAPVPADGSGMSDADIDAEINSDETSEENIDHYVGKLTAALRDGDITQLTPEKVKSVLNSVVAALPLENLSPEERLKIARRIRKGESEVEEMDIPTAMISEAKKLKEGGNTMENCKYILDSIVGGQHKHAKELFNKLRNKESFYNYLDGLDLPSEMIEGYRKYFEGLESLPTPELDETEKEENSDVDVTSDEEVPTEEPEVKTDAETGDDDEIFKKFIMKLAVHKVGVQKDLSEPDALTINNFKFVPTQGENGFTILSVSRDETVKMDFILTNDCYENTYKVLLQTAEEE